MKYLENTTLSHLSEQLTYTSPESSVHSRVEAYSCKATGKDKRLYKAIDEHWADEMVAFKASSPDHPLSATVLESPFGSLDNPTARRTFSLLITTLNAAFPDYDFTDVSPDQFTREDNGGAPILGALSNALSTPRDASNSHVSSRSFAAFPASYHSSSDEMLGPHHHSRSSRSRSLSPSNSTVLSHFNPTPPAMLNSHPALYRILSNAIPLSECEVYSYAPDIYSDPHGETDSDSDSLASSDTDSLDNWAWDDYDDNANNESSSLGGSGHYGSVSAHEPNRYSSSGLRMRGERRKGDNVDPWELSSSPDRDIIFPMDDYDNFKTPLPKKSSKSNSLDSNVNTSTSSAPSSSSTQPLSITQSPSPSRRSTSDTSYGFEYIDYPSSAAARNNSSSSATRGHALNRAPARARSGGLLWSSYWFFYHKKEKKILFITTWAKQRDWTSGSFTASTRPSEREVSSSRSLKSSWFEEDRRAEKFGGWEGAEGAGKRAFDNAASARRVLGSTRENPIEL